MANFTATTTLDPPKVRVGGEWTFRTQACAPAGFPMILDVTAYAPLGAAVSVEWRTNTTGIWTEWTALGEPLSGSWTVALTDIALEPGRCATIEMRGTATAEGTLEFRSFVKGDDGLISDILDLQIVPLTVIPSEGVTTEVGVQCLGVGEYEARFVARKTRIGRAHPVGDTVVPYSGNWSRLLNETSEANIRVTMRNSDGSAAECCETIRKLQPLRHELELYRNQKLVWAGPVWDIKAMPAQNEAEIIARDLSVWWRLRKLLQDFISRGIDLATIFEKYVKYTTSIDDYGLDVETTPTGVTGDRSVDKATKLTAADEIYELARTGVDWTVANRTAFVGGTVINGQDLRLPTVLTDESFRDPPVTRRTAAGMGNEWFVKGHGESIVGHYGEADPIDGVLIQNSKSEFSIEDQASADAAAKSSWLKGHEPLTFLQGDNALDRTAEVDIQELVPGILVPISVSGGGCLPLATELRLQRVSVNFSAGGEEVTLALMPVGSTADDG